MVFVETMVFTYCQSFPIEIISSGVGGGDYASTVVVVDSFRYTIREGEVLPPYPGG